MDIYHVHSHVATKLFHATYKIMEIYIYMCVYIYTHTYVYIYGPINL